MQTRGGEQRAGLRRCGPGGPSPRQTLRRCLIGSLRPWVGEPNHPLFETGLGAPRIYFLFVLLTGSTKWQSKDTLLSELERRHFFNCNHLSLQFTLSPLGDSLIYGCHGNVQLR